MDSKKSVTESGSLANQILKNRIEKTHFRGEVREVV